MEATICIFGDSITWGAWDLEKQGWVTRLKNYFENSDHDIIIYNCGVSGNTSEDLLARFNNECMARDPQIIIFAIGINDSKYINYKDNPSVPLEQFQDNLIKLINQAKTFSNKIIFIGTTNVDETKTMPTIWSDNMFFDNNNIEKYNSVIRKVSAEQGLLFIDIFNLLNINDLNEDGLHPNASGHEKMFLKIRDFLVSNKVV